MPTKGLILPAVPNPPLPPHQGGQQAVDARLRQANDLLSPVGPHAGRHQNILVITTPEDQPLSRNCWKNGQQWGLSFSYAVPTRTPWLSPKPT